VRKKTTSENTVEMPLITRPDIELDLLWIKELLIRIDRGEEELTDEKFFECLSKSHKYLVFNSFQVKISGWIEIMHDDVSTKDELFRAQENLKKIGSTLAFIGSGRKLNYNPTIVYWLLKKLEKRLCGIENVIQAKEVGIRNALKALLHNPPNILFREEKD
jgi:hypothetical protein